MLAQSYSLLLCRVTSRNPVAEPQFIPVWTNSAFRLHFIARLAELRSLRQIPDGRFVFIRLNGRKSPRAVVIGHPLHGIQTRPVISVKWRHGEFVTAIAIAIEPPIGIAVAAMLTVAFSTAALRVTIATTLTLVVSLLCDAFRFPC